MENLIDAKTDNLLKYYKFFLNKVFISLAKNEYLNKQSFLTIIKNSNLLTEKFTVADAGVI